MSQYTVPTLFTILEKFLPLCVHFTFTFYTRILVHFSLHSILTDKVFGVPLEELWRGEVPYLIRKVVQHVEEHGLFTEGVYRINGNAKIIEKLHASFDKSE